MRLHRFYWYPNACNQHSQYHNMSVIPSSLFYMIAQLSFYGHQLLNRIISIEPSAVADGVSSLIPSGRSYTAKLPVNCHIQDMRQELLAAVLSDLAYTWMVSFRSWRDLGCPDCCKCTFIWPYFNLSTFRLICSFIHVTLGNDLDIFKLTLH